MAGFNFKALGCILLPVSIGAALLFLGIHMTSNWADTSGAEHLGIVVVIVLGSLILLATALAVILQILLRKMFRQLGRDVRGVGRAINYILKIKPPQDRPPTP